MVRKTDILLQAGGFAGQAQAAALDPKYGGEWGYAPDPGEWLSAQGYLPRNLVFFTLETPRLFERLPGPERWIQAYKVFFERHARRISGLKAGLEVETTEHAFGGGGQMFQEYTDVKEERSTLSVDFYEKFGNVWQEYWKKVIAYGLMDPNTKIPLAATLANSPDDNLADNYAGTLAAFEPDETGKKIRKCWIICNVWPQGTGPMEYEMDKTSARSLKEVSLEFSALAFINEGTRALGQELWNGITKTWANPQLRKSFITEIAPDVAAVTEGYKQSLESIANQRIGDVI